MENYLKGVSPGKPTATEIMAKTYGTRNVVSDKNGHLHVEKLGRLTATEKAIIKGKWFWTKITIGVLLMGIAASVVVWSIYQMVLIHRFIMSL